jgi:hypothetical protein
MSTDAAILMSPEMLQSAIRLGTPMDIYYYGRETLHKQAIPTVVDTRFRQAINNLRQGSNTFIISSDQGVGDILLAVKLPEHASGSVSYTDLGVERGWLYHSIARASIRYAGSSQYFWTGAQMLIENLREMPNGDCRDRLFELGGAAMLGDASDGAGDFAGDNLYAYAYLNFPHNSPNGSLEKPNPFPTEMIAQGIVVTVEFNDLRSIFSSAAALGSLAGAPSEYESGYFQIKQTHANDRGDLMVNTADRSKAYSFPTKGFYQNEVQLNLSEQSSYSLSLTGFRSGQVRDIIFWITDNSDTDPAGGARFARNYTKFVLPKDVQLSYNGTIFADFKDNSSEFWNLVSTETPAVLQASNVTLVGTDLTQVASPRKWTEVNFGQVYQQLSASHMYVAGKTVQSGIVNLNVGGLDPAKSYTLHAMYSYNCVIMIADSTATYAF